MADNPAILVDNFFDVTQYPAHVLTSDTEAADADHPVDNVGNYRRSALNFFAATTANTQQILKVDCVVARAATAIFIDRGHNLEGKQVFLEWSTDDAAWTEVFDVTLPAAAGDGADFDIAGSANGVKTDEGAWCIRFPTASKRYWRVRIPAMGAGLIPQLVNVILGTTWEPGGFERPLDHEMYQIVGEQIVTKLGWRGSSQKIAQRVGEFGLKLTSASLEATALAQLLLLNTTPFLLIHDADVTERALLADRDFGRAGWSKARDWFHDSGRIPWTEFQPKIT